MAILETLEGDDPEMLDSMAMASAKSWEPNISDMLRMRRTTVMASGIPAQHRAAGTGKATSPNRSGRMIPQRFRKTGAQKWGSAGRYVVSRPSVDPETLEGWLTSLKKAGGAVVNTVSKGVRAVGSVQMDIARSVAPVAGVVIGKAAAAYTGNPSALSTGGMDTGGGTGILSSLSSALGFNVASAPPTGGYVQPTPAQVPASPSGVGGIPVLYIVGGGLLLVLLLKK